MGVGELTGYDYVASLTAQLPGSTWRQFQDVSGSVTANAASVSAVATAAASMQVAARMGADWRQVTSLDVDSLDIFA